MKLTDNFTIQEFGSKDGAPFPDHVLVNVRLLATNLQVLRDELGVPIRINSGYRSPAHNRKVGGAKNSQHLRGAAADIVVPGYTPVQVAAAIERLIDEGKMLEGGLSTYNTFVHYDVRGGRARW